MIALSKLLALGTGILAVAATFEPAAAEVVNVNQNGLELRETVHVSVAPDKAFGEQLERLRKLIDG